MKSTQSPPSSARTIKPEDAARALRGIWKTSVFSVFVFGSMFIVERPDAEAIGSPQLSAGIVAVAILSAGASYWVRRRAIRLEGNATSKPDVYDLEWLGRFQSACVYTWACCWGVSLSGLVLGWLSINFQEFVPFGAVALLLHVDHRPTKWPQWRVLNDAVSAMPVGGTSARRKVFP